MARSAQPSARNLTIKPRMASSRGLADPEFGLVMVIVANGLAGFFAAEQRVFEVTDAVYRALGDEIAHLRRPTTLSA